MINQGELVAKLDAFFNVTAFDESSGRRNLPAGYESVFQRFAAPGRPQFQARFRPVSPLFADRAGRLY